MSEQLKQCSSCGEWKPLTEYYKNTQRPGGLTYKCKDCNKAYNRQYKATHVEELKAWRKEYYKKNLAKIKAYDKKRYWDNREEILARGAVYKAAHAEELRARRRRRRLENLEEIRARDNAYKAKNKGRTREIARASYRRNRARISQRKKELYNTDPIFKLKMQARGMLRRSFTRKGRRKDNHSPEILGCSLDFFVEYLKQTWLDRYGTEWNGQPCHIDHIVPLATVDTKEDILRLCHYTNLRLITPEDNLSKASEDSKLAKKKGEKHE